MGSLNDRQSLNPSESETVPPDAQPALRETESDIEDSETANTGRDTVGSQVGTESDSERRAAAWRAGRDFMATVDARSARDFNFIDNLPEQEPCGGVKLGVNVKVELKQEPCDGTKQPKQEPCGGVKQEAKQEPCDGIKRETKLKEEACEAQEGSPFISVSDAHWVESFCQGPANCGYSESSSGLSSPMRCEAGAATMGGSPASPLSPVVDPNHMAESDVRDAEEGASKKRPRSDHLFGSQRFEFRVARNKFKP